MKKYLIKQTKKSISLFLAVLMLLSCWVWFAPEEAKVAQAAGIEHTGYTLSITYEIANLKYNSGHIQYKTTTNGGWGTETEAIDLKSSFANGVDDAGEPLGSVALHTVTTEELEGFPTWVSVRGATCDSADCGGAAADLRIKTIKINDRTVWEGSHGFSGAGKDDEHTATIYSNKSLDGSGTNNGTQTGTYTWAPAKVAGFVEKDENTTLDIGATKPVNISLKEIGGEEAKGEATFDISKYTYIDQYGCEVAYNENRLCDISISHYISKINNGAESAGDPNIRYDNSEGKDIVAVKPEMQTNEDTANTNGTAKFYLVRQYTVKTGLKEQAEYISRISAPINITYPTYPITFKADLSGAKITGVDENGATKVFTDEYAPEAVHTATVTPPSKTEAEGYTFYGYWEKEQPTSGDASYNAAEADFAQPCTTDEYNNYVKDGKVNGDIVTDKEGNKWYDAGRKFDATADKQVLINDDTFINEWHGWWLAEDLKVKFYDVDGSFIGEKAVKSGQTASAINFTSDELGGKWGLSNGWPVSKYADNGYTTGNIKFNVSATTWENIDGTEITNTSTKAFTKDLILTPVLTRTSVTSKYEVKFNHPEENGTTQGGSFDYRAEISDEAEDYLNNIPETPSDVIKDVQYSYELLGWSSVKPTTGKKYHVLLEDGDFDVNGTAIVTNNDWIVREAKVYYAVYRRHTRTYDVNFNYTDATGANATRSFKVKYGEKVVPPTEYVPYSYVIGGMGYTFKEWVYNDTKTLTYSQELNLTEEYVDFVDVSGGKDEVFVGAPIEINATYGDAVPTNYTVTFNYVDDEGEADFSEAKVAHGAFITQTTVDDLKPAAKWDHDEQLYTYADEWEITEGAAVLDGRTIKAGDENNENHVIDTADLTKLSPTSNLTLKAVYGSPVPFFKVTYIDGDKTFTDRVLQGSPVPEWTYKAINDNGTPDDETDDFEEDKIYAPEDYEGNGGTYEFQGWFDQKQTDEEKKETNGTKYTTSDSVTGNLTLYPQFKFVPDTFLIRFLAHDGTELKAGYFEKGQSIEDMTAEATAAASGASAKPADDTYEYLFLGWDKAVPTFCEGVAVDFKAEYRPVYKYYDVKWYNSKLENGNWVADDSALLATTHHTFNSKLYTPAIDEFDCPVTAPAGQNYVFAGWYYTDAEGNAVKYQRGMAVTDEMEFYATYTLTAQTYTVTAIIKGNTQTYTVASGDTLVIPDPQAGYADETKHDAFDRWYSDAEFENEFDLETVITEDKTIYAKFIESPHNYENNREVVTAPTYYEDGVYAEWCSCDPTKTRKEGTIAKLTDDIDPKGTIYLGGKSWSSEGDPANATDNDPVSIYCNDDTDVIITATDAGIGVKLIRAFAYPGNTALTSDKYGYAQQVAVDVYKDETQALTNNANFGVKLGDFMVAKFDENGNVVTDENGKVEYTDLVSGETYIIYYYVVDKADNSLDTKVRTAKFIYDNTAPVFEVEGDSDGKALPTYCGEATVTGIEKDVLLTVNGQSVAATYADGEETGTYGIKYAEGMDNLIITATDKAGNTYSKKIKVNDHAYHITEQASSCGVEGYKKEECLVCHHVKTEETYPALSHRWGMPQVVEADCVNNGYIIHECEICGEVVKTEFEEDGVTPVVPPLGHVFAKDADGNEIFKTVTASTCKTAGLAEAYCIECNGELEGGYKTKALPLDPANHEDIRKTEVARDCVNDGYYKEKCYACNVTIKEEDHTTDPDKYAATGHSESLVWETIREATCYQPGTMVGKCSVCTTVVAEESEYGYTDTADGNFTYVTDEDGEKVYEDGKYKYYLVPATGEHVKTLANPDTYKTEGVVRYKCATPGCPHKYEDKELKEDVYYTVTFLDEDGEEIAKETVLEGTAIAAAAVTAPKKEETVEYEYSFAGWVEVITGEDGKTTEGSTYKLPLTPAKNMTLKASYKATKQLYTHRFFVQNTWTETMAAEESKVVYAELVGAYGEERVPSATPVFVHKDSATDAYLKSRYTFEFKGWKNAAGAIVNDFTVGGDAEFTAYFEATPIKNQVIFINGDKAVGETSVVYGTPVVEEGEFKFPTNLKKDYDEEYHYVFEGKWYTDAACTTEYVVTYDADGNLTAGAITEKTRLYAGFTAVEHTFAPVANEEGKDPVNWNATCTEAGQKTEKCSCGYTKATVLEALKHDFENGEITDTDITLDDGTVIKAGSTLCARFEDCGAYIAPEVKKFTVTINEKVTYGTEVLANDTLATAVVEENGKYEFTAPEKAKTAEYEYKFVNWTDSTGKEITKEAKLVLDTVTADGTYTANYVATKRTYLVSYFDVDFKTIIKSVVVEYGKAIPVGSEPEAPEKEATANDHYIFEGWSVAEGTIVTEAIEILPVIKSEAHKFVETEDSSDATCTEPGGKVYMCEGCGLTKTSGSTPATGHKFTEIVKEVAPTYEEDGYIIKKCANCDETKKTVLPKREYKYINVTVKDKNGNLVSGAKVDLFTGETWVADGYTDGSGKVTFKVGDENRKYSVRISGVDGLENKYHDVSAGGSVETKPEGSSGTSCSCSCHKAGFWGIIFRLFHKFIKLFTGKYICCDDPSEMY